MRADRGLNGWLVVDKPLGLSSNRVVELVRRSTGTKVGHAGTLDPLATGVLPIAIGEATKTTAYAMTGRKRYRFRIRWGVARATDDREGEITGESPSRPCREAIEAILPRFIGTIRQVPPAYSAIKVRGRRAYALARSGSPPVLAREAGGNHRNCGSSASPIAIMRIARRSSARGLISVPSPAISARRSALSPISPNCVASRSGRFTESQAIPLDFIAEQGHISEDSGYLLPIETGAGRHPGGGLDGSGSCSIA